MRWDCFEYSVVNTNCVVSAYSVILSTKPSINYMCWVFLYAESSSRFCFEWSVCIPLPWLIEALLIISSEFLCRRRRVAGDLSNSSSSKNRQTMRQRDSSSVVLSVKRMLNEWINLILVLWILIGIFPIRHQPHPSKIECRAPVDTMSYWSAGSRSILWMGQWQGLEWNRMGYNRLPRQLLELLHPAICNHVLLHPGHPPRAMAIVVSRDQTWVHDWHCVEASEYTYQLQQ